MVTRSKDIPSDILALARQTQDAAIKACADEKLAVSDYPFASGHAKKVLDEQIARALLAYGQRRADEATERAAKVADTVEADRRSLAKEEADDPSPSDTGTEVDVLLGQAFIAKHIATAIRSSK